MNKTQCQLCKRLAWPIIPPSMSDLVWKRVSPLDVIIRVQSTAIFLCTWPFSAWWWRTNNQPGDPRASLLLTSEKAVFCKIYWQSKHTYLPLWGTAPRSEQKHWDPTESDRSGHRRRSQSLHLWNPSLKSYPEVLLRLHGGTLQKIRMEWHWPSIPIGNWGFAVNLK